MVGPRHLTLRPPLYEGVQLSGKFVAISNENATICDFLPLIDGNGVIQLVRTHQNHKNFTPSPIVRTRTHARSPPIAYVLIKFQPPLTISNGMFLNIQ